MNQPRPSITRPNDSASHQHGQPNGVALTIQTAEVVKRLPRLAGHETPSLGSDVLVIQRSVVLPTRN
jgi:hypothetical protein